jgi:Tfp pilus assembly protein FimT
MKILESLKTGALRKITQAETVWRDSRGFSIGELMTVVAVLGVLGAISIPQFMAFQPAMRLNGGARQVLTKLMWARAQAVQENATYVVAFPTNHTLQIFNDANLNSSYDVGEWTQTVDIQSDYSDVSFTSSGPDPIFNGRGTTNSATTTITVNNGSGSRTVTISPTGNVKIS